MELSSIKPVARQLAVGFGHFDGRKHGHFWPIFPDRIAKPRVA
jgi:hypothetical protein